MSSEIAIKVENLSKCYQIYEQPHDRLKQFILPRMRQLIGKPPIQYYREFWALKEVSFEVTKGETIGIIGRNGSGKSTLLQMICGTLNPTSGSITTNGRIAALLELGSGFNPDFTGRENVYINASVLGLSAVEIDERFEQIVAFAEIGEFIEQPIKNYSSGMMLRLAFAVIAHVNADILVVDEALSVGDAFFTQKCMGFLRAFMERGTVLFVSHDTAAVKNLCTCAVLLDAGTNVVVGPPEDVCNAYLHSDLEKSYGDLVSLENFGPNVQVGSPDAGVKNDYSVVDYGAKARAVANLSSARGWNTGVCELIAVDMKKVADNGVLEFYGGELVRVTVNVQAIMGFSNPIIGFIIKDRLGQELFGENTIPATQGQTIDVAAGEKLSADFYFRLPALQSGQYVMMVSLAEGSTENHIHHHYIHDAMLLNVSSSEIRFGIVGVPFEGISLSVGAKFVCSTGKSVLNS